MRTMRTLKRLRASTPAAGARGTALSGPFLSTVVVSFLFILGVSIVVPMLPLVVDAYGITRAGGGLLLSSFALGRLAFDLVAGVLGDRFGIRRVAVLACLVTVVASLVAATTPSYAVLLAARVAQGAGSALYMTVAVSQVITLAPDGHVGRLLAIYQGVILAGVSLGPALGGLLTQAWGIAGPFLLYAGFGVAGAVVALRWMPGHERAGAAATGGVKDAGGETAPAGEIHGGAAHAGEAPPAGEMHGEAAHAGEAAPAPALEAPHARWPQIRALLADRTFALVLLTAFTIFAVRAGLGQTLVPLLASERFGLSEGAIGLVLTAGAGGNLLVLAHAGRLVDRGGRRRTVRTGLLVTLPVAVGLALVTSPWLLFVLAAGLGVAKGYAAVVPASVLSDLASPRIRSTAVGIQRMTTDLGLLVGPFVAGAMADHLGFASAFLLTAAFVAAIALTTAGMRETAPRPATRAAA